jgi:biotin carboxyl carrier protein
MRPNASPEAPTFLGSNQLPLPPEWLPDLDSDSEPATSAVRGGQGGARVAPEYLSVSMVTPRRRPAVRTEAHRSSAAALPPPPVVEPKPERRSRSATPVERSRSRSKSAPPAAESRSHSTPASTPAPAVESRSKSAPPASRGSQPPQPAQAAQPPQPAMPELPPGLGAIDPMQVPVPPELGATIYGWVRRIALQADLAGADRLLRDALADLTSSLNVAIVYPGQDGLWTLGSDEDIPKDQTPLIAVARARRALISSHSALIPVVTSSEVVAVVVLTRNPRNPGYHPAEQVAAIALSREAGAVLHHLAVAHMQNQSEIKADQGGLYRGEALEAHRSRGNEGVPISLSPGWVRRTYPFLLLTIAIALGAAIFITVPTYSSGEGVVLFEGTPINAPAGGTVEAIYVKKGQAVTKGQALVKLHSAVEDAELAQATSDYENATMMYLADLQDEATKKALAQAATRVERARALADTRLVRARKDGTVGDLRVAVGVGLNPNDTLLSIVAPGTEPEITAFLPGKDRPRLKVGMELQVELIGFVKVRERATITSVGTEIVGGDEVIRRILGPGLGDSFKKLQGGSFIIIKAKLPNRTFKTEHREFRYYHGLQAKTEVKIRNKPFLVTLLPALEKYIPD